MNSERFNELWDRAEHGTCSPADVRDLAVELRRMRDTQAAPGGEDLMVVRLSANIRDAIRTRAVRGGITTGEVVTRAVEIAFPVDLHNTCRKWPT